MRPLRESLGELLPLPFVAVVTLLLVLIFLTPNLISLGSPAAGSFATQAYLVVDRAPGSNATHLYIRSLGNARYESVRISLATNVAWPPPSNLSGAAWNRTVNETDVLLAAISTTADPFLVNVSVVYVDPSRVTEQYIGEYEFHFTGGNLKIATITPGLSTVSPTAVADLPIYLDLMGLPLR